MDVEMDDTAISKVRDPSASIRIGPDGEIASRGWEAPRPRSTGRPRSSWVLQLVLGCSVGFIVVWTLSLIWDWSTRSVDGSDVVSSPITGEARAPRLGP
jgi:hypothetical protein